MDSSLFGTQWIRWRWSPWTRRARKSWPTEWWPTLKGAYLANTWLGGLSCQPSQWLLYVFKRVDFAALGHPSPIYINMVREPVERLVSWFYYVRAAWSVEWSENVVKCLGTSSTESTTSPIAPFLRLPGFAKLMTAALQTHMTWSVNILR